MPRKSGTGARVMHKTGVEARQTRCGGGGQRATVFFFCIYQRRALRRPNAPFLFFLTFSRALSRLAGARCVSRWYTSFSHDPASRLVRRPPGHDLPAQLASLVRRRRRGRRLSHAAHAHRSHGWTHPQPDRRLCALPLAVLRVLPAGVRLSHLARRGLHAARPPPLRIRRRRGRDPACAWSRGGKVRLVTAHAVNRSTSSASGSTRRARLRTAAPA